MQEIEQHRNQEQDRGTTAGMDPYLYEAATLGDVSILRRLRDGDLLLNHDLLLQKTPKENNILHIAAEFKQVEFFRQVPHHYSPALFWAANKNGDAPLHVAARVGCEEIVEFLIDQAKLLHVRGADEEYGHRKPLLRVTNLETDTALHVAVRYGHVRVVVMLMEADPELCCMTNSADESVLFLATRKGSAKIALYLLNESPVCPSFRGTNGVTALHAAVTRSNLTTKVMGKITTKADVFSFGVVLMELVTGLMALDEKRPEESRYLAEWFWRIKSNKEKLMAAVDPTIEVTEETFESIFLIAELAGHCTAREPSHRPDMGHAVNVLGPLVEKWKPVDEESESLSGIDYNQPLSQLLKVWQEAESREVSYTSLEDSKGSIPAKPAGFADSFTSADGR